MDITIYVEHCNGRWEAWMYYSEGTCRAHGSTPGEAVAALKRFSGYQQAKVIEVR